MYRWYKSKKYKFASNYSDNTEYVNNILNSKYNQKVFEDNNKLFYLYFWFFVFIDIIFIILFTIFWIYYFYNPYMISILFIASFIHLGIWWIGRFAFRVVGCETPPYSILRLMDWSSTFTFNLSWYYVYYLCIIYKKYSKEEVDSILEEVYHLKKHCGQRRYYVGFDEPIKFLDKPFESVISSARIRYTKKNIQDETIDVDNLVSKYTRDQIIKDMKRPYFMCHAYNIINLITTLILFGGLISQVIIIMSL